MEPTVYDLEERIFFHPDNPSISYGWHIVTPLQTFNTIGFFDAGL